MSQKEKLLKKLLRDPPEMTFEEVRAVLGYLGFFEANSSGSHHVFRDGRGRQLTIIKKGGQKVVRPYLRRVAEVAGLGEETP